MKEVFKYGRCLFIKPDKKYVEEMTEMMNNENISAMLSTKKRVYTIEKELEWIESHQTGYNFSVLDIDSLEYIGNCGFNEIDNNRGEIGITICEKMQGKHYAKEIIKGLIDYGFNVLGLDEIYSIVFSDNVRSINCMIQLGFEEYNRENNVYERNGQSIDDVYFKISR